MVPSTRRRFLATSAAALVAGVAGCTTTSDTTGDSPTDSTSTAPASSSPTPTTTPVSGTFAHMPDGPEAYPDRPTDSTREAALAYAEAFEYARTYNSLHADDVEQLEVDSRAIHELAADGGQYVLATSTGWADYADSTHADWGQLPAYSFVSPSLVVRAETRGHRYSNCEDVDASTDSDENFADICSGGDASYFVYNLSTERRWLTVTVERLTDDGSDPVLEQEYGISSTRAVEQGSVTYRRGTYLLTASFEDGPETTFEWSLQTEPSWDDPRVTVVLGPRGGLTIRRVPFGTL